MSLNGIKIFFFKDIQIQFFNQWKMSGEGTLHQRNLLQVTGSLEHHHNFQVIS